MAGKDRGIKFGESDAPPSGRPAVDCDQARDGPPWVLMDPDVVRRTLVGALVGAALFGLVPLIRLALSDQLTTGAVQPLLWFAFLGAVIGALAGPLVGQAWANRRR